MEKYNSFEKILTNLNILKYIINSKVKMGDYSTNKHVEGFYKELLNKVYGWELDKSDSLTNPGIDLACETKEIGVQVTSQKGHEKITKTLDLFDKYYLGKLKRVIIFNITSKSNHTKDFTSKVSFNKNTDIIDVDDLLVEIEKLPTLKIKEIETFILCEIPYYIGKITNEKDLLRNRCDFSNIQPKNCHKFLKISGDNEDLEKFKNKVHKFHATLLSISKRQRTAFFAFLTKCNKKDIKLDVSTWAHMLVDSFEFHNREINGLLATLDTKKLIYNNQDDVLPELQAYDPDFIYCILDIIEDNDILNDLISNVNFSYLDE